MKKSFQVSVPDPCSESWDAMQANRCGRFCASCEKTVIDFTKMSDADFATYFQNTKVMPCGRFTQRQLTLQIPFKAKPLLPFGKISKYVAAGMIAIAGWNTRASGKTYQIIQAAPSSDVSNITEATSTDSPVTIRGKVIDQNKEEVPGATIMIQNSSIVTITDIHGNFELEIPNKYIDAQASVAISIKSLAYKDLTQLIPVKDMNTEMSFKLEPNSIVLFDDTEAVNNFSNETPLTHSPLIVKGKILDEKKEGIPGATITIKNTTIGTITDIEGNFEIEIPANDMDSNTSIRLNVKALSMKDQSRTIDRSDLNIPLTLIMHEDSSRILQGGVIIKSGKAIKSLNNKNPTSNR